MDYCLLCLEINKNISNCIKFGSAQWTELDMTKVIEEHFWLLHDIQIESWICLSCWCEVEDFHKFYLRIKEAHLSSGKINVKNLAAELKFREKLPVEKFAKDDREEEKYKIEYCFMEPEVLIDQIQPRDLTEPEIFLDQNVALGKDIHKVTIASESSDDVRVKQACNLQNNLASKDPLEKTKTYNQKRNSEGLLYTEEKSVENYREHEFKVKEEPLEPSDANSDSNSINDNDMSDSTYRPGKDSSEISNSKGRKANSKSRLSRIEKDKFIAEHFKQMLCDLCQAPFENFPAMQKHFIVTHKQQCYVVCCKRKFVGRTRLVDHLHCHVNPDHFKCKDCGKVMSDRNCFHNHMLRVHRANEVVKKHSCDVCGKCFTKPSVLRIHKLSHLPEEEKKFPCADCGKRYGSSYLLNQHTQAVHLKRFLKVCYVCGKSTNSSAELKIHMNKHEENPMLTVNCDVCGLRLTSERGLKLHKESQHPVGGKKDHQCSICQKVSPTLKALQKHINTMHKKGYDRKCSICDKAFKRAEGLREHMATHTGTALYTCPWCPKTFNSNGNMHAHRKKIHPKEWEESKLQKYSSNL